MKRYLRALTVALVMAGILGVTAPAPTRAMDSCSDAYDRALSDLTTVWNNCTSDNNYLVWGLLCVPVYAAGLFDAGQAYYGCVGVPLMTGG